MARGFENAKAVPVAHARHLRRCLVLFSGILFGCHPTSPLPDVALPDTGLPFDGSRVDGAGSDASDAAEDDASFDAGSPSNEAGADTGIDASLDAWFDCSSCAAAPTCRVLSCTTSCVYAPIAEGTECGANNLCHVGECVTRGCGDGYREPLTADGRAREGCDDGNLVGGDACSPTCTPTPLVVAPSGMDVEGTPTAQLPAIAASADGTLLFVWLASYDVGGEVFRRLRAARYDAAGVLLDTAGPLVLEEGIGVSQPVRPSVAGLPHGWVVTWRSTAIEGAGGEQGGIAYRLIPTTGAMSSPRQANTTVALDQLDSRVASLSSGFVIVWTDTSAELISGDLRMRFFGNNGVASGGELGVTTTTSGDQSGAFVVSRGTLAVPTNGWTIAWTDTSSGTPLVALRRFDGSTAQDAADVGASHAWGFGPALSATGTGVYVAWTSRERDTHGDAYVRFITDHTTPADDMDVDRYALTIPATPSPLAATDDAPAVVADPFDGSDGYLSVFSTNAPMRGGRIRHSSAVTLPPEAAELSALLLSGQTAFSLTPTPRGLWTAWMDPSRTPAASAFVAYLMPWD